MADVYAGDDDRSRGACADVPQADILFVIETDPDPDALSRIAGVVSLANQAPASGSIAITATGQLTIALEIRAVTMAIQDLIRRKLVQLTCVTKADAHVIERPMRGA